METSTPKIERHIQIRWNQCLIYICVPTSIAVIYWFMVTRDEPVCYVDHSRENSRICYKKCPPAHFTLPELDQCIPWLTCDDIESENFKTGNLIGQGAVKMVYLAQWHGHTMVLNTLKYSLYSSDFHHGLDMLRAFQSHPYVTQIIGTCRDNFVTEFHKLGSLDGINTILQSENYKKHNNIDTRLSLCIGYVEIINFLHNSPLGTRVMCDSNDIEKTLNQYLLRADLSLLVNDLDALPQTDGHSRLIKCGHRQIFGDFVAPEQLWPHEDQAFNDTEMPPYDEKTDIWKIPDVCDYFLGDSPESDAVRFHLFQIHKECKSEDAKQRPDAKTVLQIYRALRNELGF